MTASINGKIDKIKIAVAIPFKYGDIPVSSILFIFFKSIMQKGKANTINRNTKYKRGAKLISLLSK